MKIAEELAKAQADLKAAQDALTQANADHKAALEAEQAKTAKAIQERDAAIKERDEQKTKAEASAKEVETLKANAKTVEEQASKKALDIAAGQGIPPVPGAGAAGAANNADSKLEAYTAEKDPRKKAALWEEYKELIGLK